MGDRRVRNFYPIMALVIMAVVVAFVAWVGKLSADAASDYRAHRANRSIENNWRRGPARFVYQRAWEKAREQDLRPEISRTREARIRREDAAARRRALRRERRREQR